MELQEYFISVRKKYDPHSIGMPITKFSQRQLTEEGRMIMVQAYSRIVKSHVKREVPDEKHIQVDIYRKVSIAQCSNAYAGCT